MNKEQEKKRQQMIFIVSVFLAVIIIAWFVSLGWMFVNVEQKDSDGSLQNIVDGIGQDVKSFNSNISDKKINFNNVISSLKNRFLGEQAAVRAITGSMMDKLAEEKMNSWSEHLDRQIYFKYPTEWPLVVDNNVLKLQYEGEDTIVITVYKDVGDLPDNISELGLTAWLDEQVDRELGIFSGYELLDLNEVNEMYGVMRKDSVDELDLYWQRDTTAYHLVYNSNEQTDRTIKLIISTIK